MNIQLLFLIILIIVILALIIYWNKGDTKPISKLKDIKSEREYLFNGNSQFSNVQFFYLRCNNEYVAFNENTGLIELSTAKKQKFTLVNNNLMVSNKMGLSVNVESLGNEQYEYHIRLGSKNLLSIDDDGEIIFLDKNMQKLYLTFNDDLNSNLKIVDLKPYRNNFKLEKV